MIYLYRGNDYYMVLQGKAHCYRNSVEDHLVETVVGQFKG